MERYLENTLWSPALQTTFRPIAKASNTVSGVPVINILYLNLDAMLKSDILTDLPDVFTHCRRVLTSVTMSFWALFSLGPIHSTAIACAQSEKNILSSALFPPVVGAKRWTRPLPPYLPAVFSSLVSALSASYIYLVSCHDRTSANPSNRRRSAVYLFILLKSS